MINTQHSEPLQVRPITILVHGIRTFGSWQERLRRLLEEQCNQDVVIFRYGYLDVLAFILPFVRRFAIKRFAQYLDENVNALRNRQINLVAHSFGTYVIAWVLLRDARLLRLNVDTVILCGSVLRQFFPWQQLTRDKTVGRVINDCGTKDIWPLMAQCFVLGLGAAGRYGFAGPLGSAVGIYNRYFPFGHDGFFAEQQMAEYWLPLLRGGASPNGQELMPPSWHRLVGFEQYGDPIKALPLLAICAWIGFMGYNAWEARLVALTTESLFLSSKALQLDTETHDHAAAMLITLGALPSAQGLLSRRPYIAAAERAFVTAATRNRLVHDLVGHNDQVRTAHYSPDGRLVGTASWDGTSRIWKVGSCQNGICPYLSLIGHAEGVNDIAFSRDSSRVVTASLDKTARVWDANSGAPIAVLTGHEGRVTSAVFSPDGSHVATASWDKTVRVWDLTACNVGTCPSIIVKFDRDVDLVAYSSDGQRIAASTALQTRVWTAATCTSNACSTITLEGKKAKFSPDGTLLATINFSFEQGHTARVYALSTCHLESCPFVTLRGHTYFINSVGFSLDGHRIVTAADDKSARVWDLASCSDAICKPAVVLGEHTDTVRAASFSADGTRVVTASGGFNATTWDARIWDLNAGDCTYGRPCPAIILAGHVGWIYGAEFSGIVPRDVEIHEAVVAG